MKGTHQPFPSLSKPNVNNSLPLGHDLARAFPSGMWTLPKLLRFLFLAGILIRFLEFGFFCLTLWGNSFSNRGRLSGSETHVGAARC